MEYIYLGAAALGGGWTGYLIGQFSSVKEMNRRLNALVDERNKYKEDLELWKDQCDQVGESAYSTACQYIEAKAEIDRLSDLVAKYQRNKPEREANGKLASKKKRVTAELAAYVASKAA